MVFKGVNLADDGYDYSGYEDESTYVVFLYFVLFIINK